MQFNFKKMYKNPLLRLHAVVFLWGFTGIMGKLIHADAHILVFYRMLLASLFLYIFIRFVKKASLSVPKKVFFQLLGIGAIIGFHWLCFFYSIKISNVSIALSCLSFSTLFASFIEPLVYKRKIDPSEVIMGVIMVICISLIFNAEFRYKEGIFFGILCAFLGTIFSVFNGKMFGKASSESIIFYEIFCGWLIVTLFFSASGQISNIHEISLRDFSLLIVLASLFTAFPMLESIKLMKFISPFTLILTVNLEPVYGIILAFFIFGASEHMSPIFYVASFIMIVSIVVNGILKARRNATNNS